MRYGDVIKMIRMWDSNGVVGPWKWANVSGSKMARQNEWRELEYLVRVYTTTVRAGTVKGFPMKAWAQVQGNCRRKYYQKLGTVKSMGAMGRREPTRKKNKKTKNTLVENSRKEWECMHVGELQQHHRSSVSHWIKWECWNILAALHRRLAWRRLGSLGTALAIKGS